MHKKFVCTQLPNTSISARWRELDGLLPAAAGSRAACDSNSKVSRIQLRIYFQTLKNGAGVSVFSTWISLIFHQIFWFKSKCRVCILEVCLMSWVMVYNLTIQKSLHFKNAGGGFCLFFFSFLKPFWLQTVEKHCGTDGRKKMNPFVNLWWHLDLMCED